MNLNPDEVAIHDLGMTAYTHFNEEYTERIYNDEYEHRQALAHRCYTIIPYPEGIAVKNSRTGEFVATVCD